MMDDRFEQWLREVGQEYHRPPATTPREEMWREIVARRAARRRWVVVRPRLRWAIGIAAVLVLGIAIGRWTVNGNPRVTPVATTRDRPSAFVYQLAAAQYLTRTDAMLTGFRAEARTGASTGQFSAQARDLLCTTRLMLDSPAARDLRLKNLLEDLELVLAEIAQLPSNGNREDVEFINQGLEQRSVMLRLRTASPTGPGGARAQGAL